VPPQDQVVNLGGGPGSAMSLRQLTEWCDDRFGAHPVASDPSPRAFDVPWIVLDCARAARIWGWAPKTPAIAILEEIAAHAGTHPDWLELSAPL
jgi:CDP-paratose 2-epimerase